MDNSKTTSIMYEVEAPDGTVYDSFNNQADAKDAAMKYVSKEKKSFRIIQVTTVEMRHQIGIMVATVQK